MSIMLNFETHFFEDDGIIPNSPLPVLIYRKAFEGENIKEQILKTFIANSWTNNWEDIILTYDHFHSTTHEVLAVAEGEVTLQIGGSKGIQILVSKGDVLILPAGVGHFSVSYHTNYRIIGGYPNGADWDLLTGTPEEREFAILNIKMVPIPTLDPVFGRNGKLGTHWF
jgi:uncharacterized protein YjlB